MCYDCLCHSVFIIFCKGDIERNKERERERERELGEEGLIEFAEERNSGVICSSSSLFFRRE